MMTWDRVLVGVAVLHHVVTPIHRPLQEWRNCGDPQQTAGWVSMPNPKVMLLEAEDVVQSLGDRRSRRLAARYT